MSDTRSRARVPPPRDAAALAVFAALTLAMTNPLVLHLASAVEDKRDALLNTWIIAWVGHALITNPLELFRANIFYPYPNTLAYSEALLPQGLFALPVNLASGNTILGYNLVLLGSLLLAACAMYLLVLDLTGSRGAAIVAGAIFSFNPYNLGNLAQVQLLSFGWMPLALLYLRRLLQRSEESQHATVRSFRAALITRDSILFAIFFSLQALSSFYFAFFAGLIVALYLVWEFIASRLSRSGLMQFVVSGLLIAVVVVPFLVPYVQVQREQGFQRKIEDSESFSASLELYTQVSPQNVLYGGWLAPHPPIMLGGYPLDDLFPGLVALGLAIVALAASRKRDRWFFMLLMAAAFLLSLGPRLFITPADGTDITLPYRWLYDVLPLLHALRAPVRFDVVVMFAVAALAGYGARLLLNQVAGRAAGVFGITTLLVALIAIEYVAVPAANITPVPVGDAIPPYVHWLAQQPPNVVLELPMMASLPGEELDLTTQYLSTYHWQETPDGYSGFIPPRRGEIAYEMESFPNGRSVALLQALGVDHVLVHSARIPDWNSLTAAIRQVSDLTPEQQWGSDDAFRVVPRAQDANRLSAAVYLPQPAAPSQNYFAYLVVRNNGARDYAVKPTTQLEIDAEWAGGLRERENVSIPLVTSTASVIQVQLRAPPEAGTYRLHVHASSDATGEWDLYGDVQVRDGEPAHQVVLPASVSLRDPLDADLSPGGTLPIDLEWKALNKIDAYYSASVRLVDSEGTKVAQQDREPAVKTLLWKPGSTIPDRFELTVPEGLAPGRYSVQVLIYQADQHMDALLLDDGFAPIATVTLGTVTID